MRRDFPYKLLIRKKWKTRFTTGYIILVNIQNTLDTRSDYSDSICRRVFAHFCI